MAKFRQPFQEGVRRGRKCGYVENKGGNKTSVCDRHVCLQRQCSLYQLYRSVGTYLFIYLYVWCIKSTRLKTQCIKELRFLTILEE